MNQPIKNALFAIKLSQMEYKYIINYLQNFNFNNCNSMELLMLYNWHKNELLIKLNTAYHKAITAPKYVSTIKVNEVEKHIVSLLYASYEFPPFMIVVFEKFTQGLIKYKSNAA